MHYLIFLLLFSSIFPTSEHALKDEFIHDLNALRNRGCYCGNDWMSGGPVTWNDRLATSATLHARQMDRYDFFEHYSRGGKDIGERVRAVGYQWRTIGENLARGHRTVDHVLRDWQKSVTHCRVLMNPKFSEMGLAKVGTYWVLHMGKPR
ncbi:MAG: CAP domain-containing protein [Saprospiraceae bacterium]|nr:CAP domain-containing protein [Saprospiraceae bacterium]